MVQPFPVPPKQAVLSTQVSGSRYFFLTLTGDRRAAVVPAYGGFERCNSDYVVRRDGLEFNTLELVVGGEGRVNMNGTGAELRPGTLFHYDRTTRLEMSTDERLPMTKYFLCLTGTRAARRVQESGIRVGAVVQLAMYAEVQRMFEELIREGQHHRIATERICRALVEVLLLRIEDLVHPASQTGHGDEETYLRCKTAIETRAAELDRLRSITRAVGVGNSQLGRLFRRYAGLSPYQFLLRRKMALAAELLMEPDSLVKEVAARVGFADPYHFSRCFKRIYLVAPKMFQRSFRV
jgi:AraC-like DNA-binding protein